MRSLIHDDTQSLYDTDLLKLQTPKVVINPAIPEVPIWKGRDELLNQLQAKLLHSENLLKVLVLVGQGGIGKTSLAVKLLDALGINCRSLPTKSENIKRCPYECVMYFKVHEGTNFDDVAKFLLIDGLGSKTDDNLKSADEKIAKIIEGLAKTRSLLVLDNLESILHPPNHPQVGHTISTDWGKLLNALVYSQHQSQTLLTSREVPADLANTRYEGTEPDSELVCIERVSGVTKVAGVEILQQRQLKDSITDLQWISERVEGHVFLLTQLAAIGKGRPGYLRKHSELVTEKAEPILKEQLAKQSESARNLLQRMCVLRVGINLRGLTFLHLYKDHWDIYLSPLIAIDIEEPAEVTNIKNISQTEQIVECLVKSSLVQESYDEEKCEKIYDLHRVIIDFLQAEYQEEMQHILKIAYHLYCSSYNVDNPKTLEDIYYLLEAQYFAFRLGKYDKSLEFLNKLSIPYLRRWGYWNLIINLYEEILPYSSKLNQPHVHLEIGNGYFECGNLENAEKHFNAALNSEDNWKKSSYLASCFYLLGKIEFVRGNYENAEYKYKEALRLWKELDQKLNITIIWSALGQIEENRGNLNEAEILYNKALQLRQDLKNDEGIAISLTSLGDIELKKGNLDKAKEDYQQALRIHIELGTRPRIAHLYCLLGYIQYKLSNWNEAKTFYQQSLSFYKELGDNSGIAISTGSLGKNELRDGNLNEAEKLLKQALYKMQELEMTEHFAKTNYYLAYLERQRGNQDLAQYYYNRGYEVFHKLGKLKDLENIENEWTQDLSQ